MHNHTRTTRTADFSGLLFVALVVSGTIVFTIADFPAVSTGAMAAIGAALLPLYTVVYRAPMQLRHAAFDRYIYQHLRGHGVLTSVVLTGTGTGLMTVGAAELGLALTTMGFLYPAVRLAGRGRH